MASTVRSNVQDVVTAWNVIFFLPSFGLMLANVVFLIWGSAERQSFDQIRGDEDEETEGSVDSVNGRRMTSQSIYSIDVKHPRRVSRGRRSLLGSLVETTLM